MKRARTTVLAGALLALAILLPQTQPRDASAHSGATGIVKQRMELMGEIEKAMKSLTAMFKGTKPFDNGVARSAAAAIRDHGGKKLTTLFPPNSLDHPTEAKPRIWEDWQDFVRLAEQLTASSDALAENMKPAIPEAQQRQLFLSLRAVCRDCHERFRQEW